MSGFAGLIRLGSDEATTAEDVWSVEQMALSIKFRGPDAQNVWSRPNVHFCFSFLKTGPAPQCASQPCSLDGQIWLLGDVRLDGRDDLVKRFETSEDKIAAKTSDEELALRVFQTFGENGVAALDGDFSFVLWDSR